MSKYRNTVLYDLKFRFLVIFFSNYQHCLVWKILFPNHFFPKSRNTVLKIFISRPPANTVPPSKSKQEIQKSTMGLGVTVTYACSVGFVYFIIRIIWSRPFLMSLMKFFSYMLPGFHQNLSNHFIIEQIPTIWRFNLAESN